MLWTVVVLLLILLLAYKLNTGITIESNILALLPTSEIEPDVAKAFALFNRNIGQKMVFLIGGKDSMTARRAADQFHQQLIGTNLFNKINYRFDEAAQQRLFDSYLPYRQMLLSSQQQHQFEQGQFAAIIKNAMQQLYSPIALTNSSLLEQDPLFLFSNSLKEMAGTLSAFNMNDGVISVTKGEMNYFLISAWLDFAPFSREGPALFAKFYATTKTAFVRQYPAIVILSAGVIHHAIAGADSAKQQISIIGIGSLLGILLLIYLAFGSLRPLWFSLLPIAVGLLTGFLACLLVFKQVHLITLVFGASLIGVSIDYCFHYFADQYDGGNHWDAKIGLQRLFPGITLGLVTSLIGYAALWVAPFPGLQQIAIFSSVGLLASYLCVICWFPGWLSVSDRKIAPVFKSIAMALLNVWDNRTTSMTWITLLLLIIILVTGLNNLQVNDDIRMLQNSPAELIQQEQQIMEIFQLTGGNRFFLIKAETEQAVLEKEEQLGKLLREQIQQGALSSYQAISQVLPSIATQQKNYRLVRAALLQQEGVFRQYFQDIGFDQAASQRYFEQFKPLSTPPLSIAIGMNSPILDSLRFLWLGKLDHGYGSMVALSQIKTVQSIALLETQIPDIFFIDHVEDVSKLLKRYRQFGTRLVIAAYLTIFILLIIRYRLQKACLVIFPPLLAAGFALAITALLGVQVNLFNTLALLLVLGIGIDYTLFFAENTEHRQTTMLAIMLSAITTILSFGLLTLSYTPVIQSFGLMVLVGISMAFLSAPIVNFHTKQ